MVRLLQKLLGDRHRGVDTPRSPAGRALTLPAPKKPRPSCRLQLEPLEDRLVPAWFMNFAPIAHVAVNPQPLPPSVDVEFDPSKNFNFPSAGMATQQEHLTGVLSKQIGMPGSATACWILEAFYNLNATVTETAVPPSPFAAGSVSDTFSLTGTVTDALIPVAPTTGPTWLFIGTLSENGTLNSIVSLPDPTTGMQQIAGQWQFSHLTLQRAVASDDDGISSWQETAQTNSTGHEVEVAFLAGTPDQPLVTGPITATFWQKDQATECLMQVIPFHPPNPRITVNASFDTWGSVSWTNTPLPGAINSATLIAGTEQYTDQGMETILMPDGSMQTVMQTSMDMGTFFCDGSVRF